MATVVVAARYVPRPPDDAIWVGTPTRSAFYTLTSLTQLYAPTAKRIFTPGDTSSEAWYRRPQSNFNLLLGAPVAPPVLPFRPNFNMGYDLSPGLWTGAPRLAAILRLPVLVLNPFRPARWNFNMVPETFWVGRPHGAYLLNTPLPPPTPIAANEFRLRLGVALGIGGF